MINKKAGAGDTAPPMEITAMNNETQFDLTCDECGQVDCECGDSEEAVERKAARLDGGL